MKLKILWNEKRHGKERRPKSALQIYYDYGVPRAPLTVKIYAPAALVWLSIGTVASYLLVSSGLSYWALRHPRSQIDPTDMFLPWEWSRVVEHYSHRRETSAPAAPVSGGATSPIVDVPRRPSIQVAANQQFNSSNFMAELDRNIAAGEWIAADRLLSASRRSNPESIAPLGSKLAWREIRIAFELGDKLRASYLVGQHLHFQRTDTVQAIALARESLSRGDSEGARLITVKVLERIPTSSEAKKFLEELDALSAPKN